MNKRTFTLFESFTAIIRLLLVVTTTLFLSACSEKSEPLEMIPVNLALPMQPASGLVMVALEKGYFEKNGLNINAVEYPSGKRAMNESFLLGKSDIAISADVPLVKSILSKHQFTMVASVFNANNVNRVIARRDTGIEKPSDLIGKRVATQKSSAVHFFLHLFLTEHGIDEKEIKPIFFKAEKLPGRLSKGEIDAFSMREPYISQAKSLLGDNHIIFAAPGLYRQNEVVVVRNNFIKEDKRAVTRFLKAVIEAEAFVKEYPKQAMEIIAKKLGVQKQSLEQRWPEINMNVRLEQSMLLLMEDISRWAIGSKLVEKQPVPNLLEYISVEPLQQVSPDAVTIIR